MTFIDQKYMLSHSCSNGILVCTNCSLSFNNQAFYNEHISSCQQTSLKEAEALSNIASGSASGLIDDSSASNCNESNYPHRTENFDDVDLNAFIFVYK